MGRVANGEVLVCGVLKQVKLQTELGLFSLLVQTRQAQSVLLLLDIRETVKLSLITTLPAGRLESVGGVLL